MSIDAAGSTDAGTHDPQSVHQSMKELPGTAWKYIFGRALRGFMRDGCMDLAAALTYRTIFAIFPALLAIVSTLGLFGQAQKTTDYLLKLLGDYTSPATVEFLREPITQLAQGGGAGLAFAIGVLGAVWTASNYVTSFGRAMNKIYGVEEGRPGWVLRPVMFALTLALLIGMMICLLILIVSGSIAQTLGNVIGLGDQAVAVWDIAKWPVLVVLVISMVAALYQFTPNVKLPRFRFLSIGSVVAIVVLGLAVTGFGFYLANFANYNKTYGSIGGAIGLLLLIWIVNSVLLFGAEVDSEVERARELGAGIPAEVDIQLQPRSTAGIRKKQKKLDQDIREGRALRLLANPITYQDLPHHHTGARWLLGFTGALAAAVGLERLSKYESRKKSPTRHDAGE